MVSDASFAIVKHCKHPECQPKGLRSYCPSPCGYLYSQIATKTILEYGELIVLWYYSVCAVCVCVHISIHVCMTKHVDAGG